MSQQPMSELWRRVRHAQRRLFMQQLLNGLLSGWFIALMLAATIAIGLPLILSAPSWLVWAIPVGLMTLLSMIVILFTTRKAPSRQDAAQALDTRFDLSERVTTAVALEPSLGTGGAGLALLADAESRVKSLAVAERFPIRANWRALMLPVQVVMLVLLAVYYQPMIALAGSDAANDGRIAQAINPPKPGDGAKPAVKPVTKSDSRLEKSERLKQLEAELEKQLIAAEQAKDKPSEAREKISKLDQLAQEIQQHKREQLDKFDTLQRQMQQLDREGAKESAREGPAKDARESIARGDTEKAKKDVDRLRKKVKNKELTEKQKEQLTEQLDEIKSDIERLTRQEEKQKKLEEAIKDAKSQGRDADALERELDEVKKDIAENSEMQKLAEKFNEASKAMKDGDMEKAAEQLEEIAKQLEKTEEGLKDLEEVKEHLQRLKEARKQTCKACEGGDQPGTKPGNGLSKKAGRGEGERPDNPDAKTSSEDQRVDGDFDSTGKKTYAGTTKGPAFNKRSKVEMAGEIQDAVQEAPEAVEVQRLSRAAREMVREYFEKLGNQGKP